MCRTADFTMVLSVWPESKRTFLATFRAWNGFHYECRIARLAYRSLRSYACQAIRQSLMQLCRPFSLRLSPELLRWLDSWRGDRMSRGTAIRLLLQQAMEQQAQS